MGMKNKTQNIKCARKILPMSFESRSANNNATRLSRWFVKGREKCVKSREDVESRERMKIFNISIYIFN